MYSKSYFRKKIIVIYCVVGLRIGARFARLQVTGISVCYRILELILQSDSLIIV